MGKLIVKKTSKKLRNIILLISSITLTTLLTIGIVLNVNVCKKTYAANYNYVTFNVGGSQTKIAVIEGQAVDFSQVAKTYKYNGSTYQIEGWTEENVIYPWQPEYVKGYKYTFVNEDNFTPSGDITINAVILDTGLVVVPDGQESLSGWEKFKINAMNWFTQTEAGKMFVKCFEIVGWVIVGILGLVAFVIICYFIAKGVKMFK